MPPLDPSTLMIMLLMFGATATILAIYLLRAIYRVEPEIQVHQEGLPIEESQHVEGILIVQRGGRLVYINQRARELFNTWEETSSLEGLVRKVRPTDAFFNSVRPD